MSNSKTECDEVFLKILRGLCDNITKTARDSEANVMLAAQQVLSDESSHALQDFHDMYFGQAVQIQDDANKAIDDLFDSIQNELVDGKDPSLLQDHQEVLRVGIASTQKKLETMATLEKEMREKIIPFIADLKLAGFLESHLDALHEECKQSIQRVWKLSGLLSPCSKKVA